MLTVKTRAADGRSESEIAALSGIKPYRVSLLLRGAARADSAREQDVRETIAELQKEMLEAADALEFERAAFLRDQLAQLKRPPKPGRRKKA